MTARLASRACLAALFLASCTHSPTPARTEARSPLHDAGRELASLAEGTMRTDSPELCAALRGNGYLVMGHFNGLARLTEHFGAFDGLAGGSSSTITMFLYESMAMNPALRDCGAQGACSPEQVGVRLSFLLKSVWGYIHALSETPEARTLFDLIGAVQKLQADLKQSGAKSLAAGASEAQALDLSGKLKRVLAAPELRGLINPEFLLLVSPNDPALRASVEPRFITALGRLNPKKRVFLLNEAFTGLKTFGNFEASDRKIFFRPGVISFPEFGRKLGRIANFYAGRGFEPGERSELKDTLDSCADKSRDKPWSEIQEKDPACAGRLENLISSYRTRIAGVEAARHGLPFASREQDRVGEYANIMVSAAIFEKPETDLYAAGLARYLAGEDPNTFDLPLFNGLEFGYWGHDRDLERTRGLPQAFDDYRSRHSIPLSDITWLEAISYSPAEPGISRFNFLPGPEGRLSGAGWSDLSPVPVLRNLGCKKVVYVSRIGEDAKFAQGIATDLGMTPIQQSALYDVTNPRSTFAKSLSLADAVWCTNWDLYTPQTLGGLNLDSYDAPLEYQGPSLKLVPYLPYPKTIPATHIGCGGTSTEYGTP